MKTIVKIVTGVLLLFLIAGCAGEQKVVKIGILHGLSSSIPYAAIQEGFFEDDNVSVEIVRLGNSNLIAEAVINNQVDIGMMSSTLPYLQLESKIPGKFKVVTAAMRDEKEGVAKVIASASSDIYDLTHLQGKTIGVFPGSTQTFLAKEALGHLFDVEQDITIIPMPPQAQLEALRAGKVDALFTIEPTAVIAVETGLARVISQDTFARFVLKPYPSAVSAVSTEFLNNYPETAKRLIRAMYRTIAWGVEHDEKLKDYLAEYLEIDRGIIGALPTLATSHVIHTDFNFEIMQPLVDYYAENGLISQSLEIADVCLPSHYKVD